jgi:hypothetical protein
MSDEKRERAQDEKAGRRSPSYPGFGLGTALEMARKIYEKEKRAPVPPHVAAEDLGYAGLSGPSRRALTTLKLYGLFAEDSGKLRITEQGVRILEAPDDHSDRDRLLREAAIRPTIFREIIAKYGDSIPGDSALRYALITEWGFLDFAANVVVKAFRETASLAKPPPKGHDGDMEGALGGQTGDAEKVPKIADILLPYRQPSGDDKKPGGPWAMRYPVGRSEFMTVAKESPPTLKQLRLLIKGIEHHLAMEAEAATDDDAAVPDAATLPPGAI